MLLQIPHQYCSNFADNTQEKPRANIEQKDKIVRKTNIDAFATPALTSDVTEGVLWVRLQRPREKLVFLKEI